MTQYPTWSRPVIPSTVTSIEEAQACFAGVYDGDYTLSDLLHRQELTHAVLYLYGKMALKPATPKPTTFRGDDGQVTTVTRSRRTKRPNQDKVEIEQVIVIVRNGRVERFTG